MVFILSVLGVVLVLEGIPYFALPGRLKQWALVMQDIPDSTLRIMGFVSMLGGLMLLLAVRSLG